MPRALVWRAWHTLLNMPGRFAAEISPAEAACGFDVKEHTTGVRIVTRELRGGLCAIKSQSEDGETIYEICDDRLTPLYAPAASLSELKRRFSA